MPYKPKIGEEICRRIITSRIGLSRCLEEMRGEKEWSDTPSLPTIYRWIEDYPEFAEKSARARLLSAESYVDEALHEAYTVRTAKTVVKRIRGDSTEIEERVTDNVERSKLIAQILLRRAGQLNPKKYGERILNEHSGPGGNPMVVAQVSAANLTDDELAAIIRADDYEDNSQAKG